MKATQQVKTSLEVLIYFSLAPNYGHVFCIIISQNFPGVILYMYLNLFQETVKEN